MDTRENHSVSASLVSRVHKLLMRPPFTETPGPSEPEQPELQLFGVLAAYAYMPKVNAGVQEQITDSIHCTFSSGRGLVDSNDESMQKTNRVRNITAAVVVTDPGFLELLTKVRTRSSMPRSVTNPFWQGIIVGALEGLVARAGEPRCLTNPEVTRTVTILGQSLSAFNAEAVQRKYMTFMIDPLDQELEQTLSKMIAHLTDLAGFQVFTEPFINSIDLSHYTGFVGSLTEQVERHVLIKAFARATIKQLQTGFKYRDHVDSE